MTHIVKTAKKPSRRPCRQTWRALLTALLAVCTLLASCGRTETEVVKKPSVPDEAIVEYDDKYRNFYEIFVRSFYDTDGDGFGDFNGITQKLDYLKPASGAASANSLGINGIWLMPICPSPSYHKYDIKDYCAVDPMYGTMEDFENLVQKCHERNITLIIDMVLNHSSKEHEWFKAFCDVMHAKATGQESQYDEKYGEYYSYITAEQAAEGTVMPVDSNYSYLKYNNARYRPIPGTDCYYECNFSDDMPELNYDSDYVWEEVEKICDFWIDKGVDGFRFDAVLYFYFNDHEKNAKVLRRITDYCKSKNPKFYTVGEAWTGATNIRKYYKGALDSLFNFPFANNSGSLLNTVQGKDGTLFAKRVQNWNNSLKLVSETDAIDAPFISNHDMSRSSSYFRTLGQRKIAASLYLMMPGNPFIYYGEEIGLKGNTTDGTKKDPTARMAIKWSATEDGSNMTAPPNADLRVKQDDIGGVYEQLKDEDSLLTHYRLLLKLRNQNPQIARGTVTAKDFGKSTVAAYTCVYDGTAVLVVHNLSLEEASFDLKSLGLSDFTELRGYVIAKNAEGENETDSAPVIGAVSSEPTDTTAEEKDPEVTLSGGQLVLPGRATAVLRSTEHYDDVVIRPDSITTSPEDDVVQPME